MFKQSIKASSLIFSLILCTSLINASVSNFKANFPLLANIQTYGYPFGQIYEILQLPELEKSILFRKLELCEFLDLSLATQTLENVIEDEKGHNPKYDSDINKELEEFIIQNGKEIPEILSRLNKAKKQRLQSAEAKQFNQLQRSNTLIQADKVNQMQRSKALTQTDNDFQFIGKFNIAQINSSFQEAWTNSINTKDKEILITFLISLINDKINLKRTGINEFKNILIELKRISSECNHFGEYTQKRLKETIAILEKLTARELSIVY